MKNITNRIASSFKMLLVLMVVTTWCSAKCVSLENSAVVFSFKSIGMLGSGHIKLMVFGSDHTFYTVSNETMYYDGSLSVTKPLVENLSTSISFDDFSAGTYSFELSSTEPGVGSLVLNGGSPIILNYDSNGIGGNIRPDSGIIYFHVFPFGAKTGAVNVSNRCWSSPVYSPTTGFVLASDSIVLIRAVGGSLKQFAVPSAVTSTNFTVYDGKWPAAWVSSCVWNDTAIRSKAFSKIFASFGAFSLNSSGVENVYCGYLRGGAYTVVSSGGQDSGEILTEVYVLSNGN